jgi:hypothetical protein
MEETPKEFEKRIRKEIDDYWDSYREGIRKFDHQALYISSGALAFSLTFVKEICPFDKSIYLCLLFCSSGFFIGTIFLGFLNQIISAQTNRNLADRLTKFTMANEVEEETKFNAYQKRTASWIRCINYFLLFFITGGLACLILYCTINIKNSKIHSKDSEETKGININFYKAQNEK